MKLGWLGVGLGLPKEPRDMGEGLVTCGGGGGGDCAACCCFGGNCQFDAIGPPNGSFDDPESGRDEGLGLKDANDCCVGGSGFCPAKGGNSCCPTSGSNGF